jgi:hypothetical protein
MTDLIKNPPKKRGGGERGGVRAKEANVGLEGKKKKKITSKTMLELKITKEANVVYM